MSAVEYNFPNPAKHPSWLAIAVNVFNDWVGRWNTATCGGGLKWQIFEGHLGFDYKNAIANGAFFQLAARLTRHTGNETYLEWAERSWNWTTEIGLIDGNYNVYDGTDDTINCTEVNHIQWSYNVGMFLYGSAILYNYTNASDIWTSRTTGLLDAVATFVSPYSNATNIMYEAYCEEALTCNPDQQSFKAYLARWMATSGKVAPYTTAAVSELLRVSAGGASLSCSGGIDNVTCGSKWYTGGWDGTYGVGQQLTALEVIQGLLFNYTAPPRTLPNVHISNPPPAKKTILPIPRVAPSSRPLVDLPPSAGFKHLDTGWALALVLGFLSIALLMMRC
jgi:mannan endo-1,6-alpha-mannosidase